ncbi:MAG TPA: hypothetical protein VNZ53_35465 [Steroidobacteraceae bacterium]|nr:hypothetical protein [Steroidobacteraceae bacterium]
MCLVDCPNAFATIAGHSYYANACINFDSSGVEITAESKQSLARLLAMVDTPTSSLSSEDKGNGYIGLRITLLYDYGLATAQPDRENYRSFLNGELSKQQRILEEIRKEQVLLKTVRHAHLSAVKMFNTLNTAYSARNCNAFVQMQFSWSAHPDMCKKTVGWIWCEIECNSKQCVVVSERSN